VKTVPTEWPKRLPAKIAFVGEAPGDHEFAGDPPRPLIGPSGWLFNRMLKKTGIERSECMITNVIDWKLPANKVEAIAVPRKDLPDPNGIWKDHYHTPVVKGGYLRPDVVTSCLNRLYSELDEATPNVVVALGGLATWAMLAVPGHGVIKKLRGTLHHATVPDYPDPHACSFNKYIVHGRKVLPTYHPAYVIRQFNHRPMLWADFLKARAESEFPEIRPVVTDITIPLSVNDIQDWWDARPEQDCLLAVDIETSRGRIDCIGFAYSAERALCVPLIDTTTGTFYWDSKPPDDMQVYQWIAEVLTGPCPKLFQNGSYDVQWIWEKWHIAVNNYAHDTRLLHHALWPELPKDLGTMASLHTDLPQWKPLRGKRMKRED